MIDFFFPSRSMSDSLILFYLRSFIRFKYTNIAPTFLGKICITPLLIYNFQSRFWSHEICFNFRQKVPQMTCRMFIAITKSARKIGPFLGNMGRVTPHFLSLCHKCQVFFNFAAVRFLCMAIYTSAPILKMTGKTCEIFCTLLFGNPTEEPL